MLEGIEPRVFEVDIFYRAEVERGVGKPGGAVFVLRWYRHDLAVCLGTFGVGHFQSVRGCALRPARQ